MKRLFAKEKMIVDENGCQVILNGINLVCKEKSRNYIEKCDESTFQWFASMGFNVIRLGLIWDGVEPEPNKYNDEYLAKIGEFIKSAHRNEIYVFLDMHQDLFSYKFADGAPEWATLTDGLPHTKGDLWSDAYLESEAVMRAFDNFWQNKPAADGVGILDRYTNMWRHVAEFYKDYNNVIGYDIMNEPFMGSSSQLVLGSFISTYAREVLGMKDINMDELANLWFDPVKKGEVLAGMAEMRVYRKLVEEAGEYSRDFERTLLTPFYNKAARAIREVDEKGFIFFETNYFSNMAVESGLEAITDINGVKDISQVYAPHGYDLVVDTDRYEVYNQPRVYLIFETHKKVQDRLNIPALVGEWGAFTKFDVTYELAINIIKIFEKYQWSNTYWCYYEGIQKEKYIEALNRAYPMVTNGEIINYSYDYDTRKFSMEYIPNGKAGETIIYYPNVSNISAESISISTKEKDIIIDLIPNSCGGHIKINSKECDQRIKIVIDVSL